VHDGYVLTKSVSRSPVGGRLLNSCLQKAVEARGCQLKPRQTFKRVEKKGFPGEFDVSHSHIMFLTFYGHVTVDFMVPTKEVGCYCCQLKPRQTFKRVENKGSPGSLT
jgi:hypothetical protein